MHCGVPNTKCFVRLSRPMFMKYHLHMDFCWSKTQLLDCIVQRDARYCNLFQNSCASSDTSYLDPKLLLKQSPIQLFIWIRTGVCFQRCPSPAAKKMFVFIAVCLIGEVFFLPQTCSWFCGSYSCRRSTRCNSERCAAVTTEESVEF